MSEDDPRIQTTIEPPDELQNYLPKHDAINRYERVIDNQIDTLNNIDQKAEHLTRLLIVIIGVVISAVKITFNFGNPSNRVSAVFSAFLIGIGCLLVSLTYAIVTYLSSRYVSGPNRALASDLAELQIPVELYASVTLDAYASAMEINKSVVEENARRFRNSLTAILVGTLFLTYSGVMLLIGEKNSTVAWGSFVAVFVVSVLGLWYLTSGKYVVYSGREKRRPHFLENSITESEEGSTEDGGAGGRSQ